MDDFYRRKMRIYIALFLLVVWSGIYSESSSAEDYYWVGQPTGDGQRHRTPDAACAGISTLNLGGGLISGSGYARSKVSDTSYRCDFKTSPSRDTFYLGPFPRIYYASRMGSGCTAPLVYNPQTGACEAPEPDECESKLGQKVSWDSKEVQFQACISGCIAGLTDSFFPESNSRQAYKIDVSELVLFRNNGEYTGASCSAPPPGEGSENPPAEPDSEIPPTESSSENECSATIEDGEGRKVSSCAQTDVYKDQRACVESGGALGTSKGMLTCIKSKGPTATKTTTEKKVTTETTPDGGTKTKEQTTTTTKKCIGTNACTTTSTTITNTNTTKSDGTSGSGSSSCSGDNCNSDGTSGEGKGKGKGDGKDGEGEGDEGAEGPAGPAGTLKKGEQGSFAEGIAEWDQRLAEARAELDTKVEQVSSQFRGVFDLDLSGGSGSLLCETFPISFGTTSTTLRLCPADYSDQLSYLRYALLLGAAVLGAIIVLRG